MTASLRTVLDLPGSTPSHEGKLRIAAGEQGKWAKSFVALREGGQKDKQHSLGLHLYVLTLPDGCYGLKLRWSNGLVRKNGKGFVGRIFFDSLKIELHGDEDLIFLPEPRAGQLRDVSQKALSIAHGGGHGFQPRGILERTIVVVPRSATQAQMDYAARVLYAYEGVRFPAPGSAPWGPARERQPVVDRKHYETLFRGGAIKAKNLLASGQPGSVRLGPSGTWANLDLRIGARGPWNPDGDPQAGAPAGYEIECAFGWPQCAGALELSAVAHECSMSRNSVAMNDLDTGEQLSVHDWPNATMGQPQLLQGEPGPQNSRLEIVPFTVGSYPSYRYPDFNAGSCAYLAALESYSDDDTEHVVRAFDDAAFLAFSANDPMAMDDLRALMEHHRHMRWSDRGDEPTAGAHWLKSTTRMLAECRGRNHRGHSGFLRSYAHMTTLATLTSEKLLAEKLVDCFVAAYDSCGIAQWEFHAPYLPAGIQGTQHFHNALDQAAVLRACRMLGDKRRVDAVLKGIRIWGEKVVLNPATRGVAKWIHRCRPDGTEIDPITANDRSPEVMAEHVLCVLGLAALCEIDRGDKAAARYFLEAGLTVDVPHANLDARLAWLKSLKYDRAQYASYQAAIEALSS